MPPASSTAWPRTWPRRCWRWLATTATSCSRPRLQARTWRRAWRPRWTWGNSRTSPRSSAVTRSSARSTRATRSPRCRPRTRRRVLAEGIVGRDEIPGLAARFRHRLAERGSPGVRVVGPVDEVARALRTGQDRGSRARADDRLVLFVGDGQDRERHRGIRQVHDHIDPVVVEPSARDGRAYVRLVLVVGRHDLDRHAETLREVVDRKLRRDDRALALVVGIDARHVVHDADLERRRLLGEGFSARERERRPGE